MRAAGQLNVAGRCTTADGSRNIGRINVAAAAACVEFRTSHVRAAIQAATAGGGDLLMPPTQCNAHARHACNVGLSRVSSSADAVKYLPRHCRVIITLRTLGRAVDGLSRVSPLTLMISFQLFT